MSRTYLAHHELESELVIIIIMEQARNLSESWKLDLASQEPMSAQAESLSLVYCRHPDSSLVGDYRTSGGTTHAVIHSTCFCP